MFVGDLDRHLAAVELIGPRAAGQVLDQGLGLGENDAAGLGAPRRVARAFR